MDAEERIQAECFKWHWNNCKEERRYLYLHHNNPCNKVHGKKLKAMGLVDGLADMGYLMKGGRMAYIEFKRPPKKCKQQENQILFEQRVTDRGALYFICRSVEEFKQLIKQLNR